MNTYKINYLTYLICFFVTLTACQPEGAKHQSKVRNDKTLPETLVKKKGTLQKTPIEMQENLAYKPVKDKEVVPKKTVENAKKDSLPSVILKLMKAYPDFIKGGTNDSVIWSDGSRMALDDGKANKSYEENLVSPDLSDQFLYAYPKGRTFDKPAKDNDPGRIRYEPFFYKMYGNNKKEVEDNLVEIVWLPKSAKQHIKVTKVNDIAQKIINISEELEKMPSIQKYLKNIGGTFNWRLISGTNRISTHSFGMTIDINTTYANYWQWDCKCKDEHATLSYKNEIPLEIVAIFEKYGFIWGGKWYHYDTMHFEYRPELLI